MTFTLLVEQGNYVRTFHRKRNQIDNAGTGRRTPGWIQSRGYRADFAGAHRRRLGSCSKKVLFLSENEAQKLEHHYIGTEHLLLGLMRESKESLEVEGTEGIAVQTLHALGVDLAALESKIFELIEK